HYIDLTVGMLFGLRGESGQGTGSVRVVQHPLGRLSLGRALDVTEAQRTFALDRSVTTPSYASGLAGDQATRRGGNRRRAGVSQLASKAKSAILWSGGFKVTQNLLQFGLTVVLARLLSPADFGTYAVVAGIIGVLNAASSDNFLAYLLQERDESQLHLQVH